MHTNQHGSRRTRIVLFGGSFNPPGKHHEIIVQELARRFDRVVVIPCGARPDKVGTNVVSEIHRAAMVDLAFGTIQNVHVDLFDLEHNQYTRTVDLDHKYRHEGEVWHVIGADLVQGGRNGGSAIQVEWKSGARLWNSARFVVVERDGYPLIREDLPPRSIVIKPRCAGSSSTIRQRIASNQSISGLVSPRVREYIKRYGLYTPSMTPHGVMRFANEKPSIELIVDENNNRAKPLIQKLRAYQSNRPNLLVVVGGDGVMLHAIRKHWRRRLPFLGLNVGTIGFLMNHVNVHRFGKLFHQQFFLRQSPLLHVEVEREDGTRLEANAFNDAWVERKTGQAAWVRVSVNGVVRIPRLVGDGALVATAAGSTAYARAMGATPLHVDSPSLLLIGSNVYEPQGWRSAHLPLSSVIEFRSAEPNKRPLTGFIDGIPEGDVVRMKVRISRIAAPELLFLPGNEISEKLTKIQFPSVISTKRFT